MKKFFPIITFFVLFLFFCPKPVRADLAGQWIPCTVPPCSCVGSCRSCPCGDWKYVCTPDGCREDIDPDCACAFKCLTDYITCQTIYGGETRPGCVYGTCCDACDVTNTVGCSCPSCNYDCSSFSTSACGGLASPNNCPSTQKLEYNTCTSSVGGCSPYIINGVCRNYCECGAATDKNGAACATPTPTPTPDITVFTGGCGGCIRESDSQGQCFATCDSHNYCSANERPVGTWRVMNDGSWRDCSKTNCVVFSSCPTLTPTPTNTPTATKTPTPTVTATPTTNPNCHFDTQTSSCIGSCLSASGCTLISPGNCGCKPNCPENGVCTQGYYFCGSCAAPLEDNYCASGKCCYMPTYHLPACLGNDDCLGCGPGKECCDIISGECGPCPAATSTPTPTNTPIANTPTSTPTVTSIPVVTATITPTSMITPCPASCNGTAECNAALCPHCDLVKGCGQIPTSTPTLTLTPTPTLTGGAKCESCVNSSNCSAGLHCWGSLPCKSKVCVGGNQNSDCLACFPPGGGGGGGCPGDSGPHTVPDQICSTSGDFPVEGRQAKSARLHLPLGDRPLVGMRRVTPSSVLAGGKCSA